MNRKRENMITSMQEMIEEQESHIRAHQSMIQRENDDYQKKIKAIMADAELHDQERQLECQIVETKAFIQIHKLNAKIYTAREQITYIQRRIMSF